MKLAFKFFFIIALIFVSTSSIFAVSVVPNNTPFSMPFHIVDGFIIIDGNVGGVAGKFMFDTGTPFAELLNNHFLSLDKDKLFVSGSASSGQKIEIYEQNSPVNIELLDQVKFNQVANVKHADFHFIEQAIVQRYLGFIGHEFNKRYVFLIDYNKQVVNFYPAKNFKLDSLKQQYGDPFAVLSFTRGHDGQMPIVELNVGKTVLSGFFDTGNQGSLTLNIETQKELQKSGELTVKESKFHYGVEEKIKVAKLKALNYQSSNLGEVSNLVFKTGDANKIGMGYQFLKNYITVWDYKRNKIYLYEA